jgi:hypothetical protein
VSETFSRQQVDAITAPWLNLCKEQEEQITKLQADNGDLLSENADLQTENADLLAENAKLQAELDEHRVAIAYYDLIPILIEGLKELNGGHMCLMKWDDARAAIKESE